MGAIDIGRGGTRLALIAMAGALLSLSPATVAQAASRAQGPDPAVAKWPRWPYPTSCDGFGLPFDPVAVFSGPTGAELGSLPSEVALRNFLQTEGWIREMAPVHDWRLLAETSDRAEFASGRLSHPDRMSSMSFEQAAGTWKWSGFSSGCQPISIVGGQPAITWHLAAAQKTLRGRTRKLLINLGPGPCASGMSQNARAMKPIFRSEGRKLLMIMRLRPLPPGGYTCQGIIEPPLEVRLPGSLGNRRLYDGGAYPPVDVVKRWRELRAGSSGAR